MSYVVWLTGLPASGKTTIANALAVKLKAAGRPVYVLDGDVLRKGLCSDLGFSLEDRHENIRRAGEVAALFADYAADMVVVTAFISPHVAGRKAAREAIGDKRFIEVHLDPPLEACESRDPKGNYARAHAGELSYFTGVTAPYEPPERPDLVLDTHELTVDTCVKWIIEEINARDKEARREESLRHG